MLKEALQYLVEEMSPADVRNIDGETYADRPMYRICHNPKAEPINMNTLTSLIDYIKAKKEYIGDVFVHVVSPTRVELYSTLDVDRVREHIVTVKASVPEFAFDRYTGHEFFCIGLQSTFIPNNDRELLLKFAGTVEQGTVEQYGDDGVTQKATIKTGIASKGEAIVPNPVILKPYRTFIEVDQPESSFIFRMRGNSGIDCALFEADGGAWKMTAMHNIKAFLEEHLKEMENVTVIA